MSFMRVAWSIFILLILTQVCLAMDPVSWSVSPSGLPAQTTVGNSYSVTYTLTNNLPHAVPIHVSAIYSGGSFVLTDGCNTSLAAKNHPKSSCLMVLQFQPKAPGVSSAALAMNYHNNIVPLPLLSSTTSKSIETIQGIITQALPAITYIGSTYPIQFTFVNHGVTPITAKSVILIGFTPTSNNCSKPIAVNGRCQVFGSFSPTEIGQATLGATYN